MGAQSLPPELWIDVFALCIEEEPTLVGCFDRVCVLWRSLLTTTPALFQSIVLTRPSRSRALLKAQTKVFLDRSHPLPFDVHLSASSLNDIFPLLVPFFDHAILWRWRRVEVQWENEIRTHIFEPTPRQTSIWELDLRDPYELELDVAGGAMQGPNAHADAVANAAATRRAYVLESLPFFHSFPRAEDFSLRASLYTLPSPQALGALPFTRLELTEAEHASVMATHPRVVLAFLSALPNLTMLRWSAWPREFEDMHGLPPVSLPALHTLGIANTLCLRRVLHALHVPALRALHLSNLNVHAALPPALERFDAPEDGDSDDEAADFSQSPSSDLATGMALRALITNCAPPLRVLEMDYVDMRTKDFAWCFDRLHQLCSFRIVGSDMSNTVIGLLRPEPHLTPALPGGPQGDPKMPSGLVSDGKPPGNSAARINHAVRLPSLSRVEITGALRLTGDALVGALLARENYTRSITAHKDSLDAHANSSTEADAGSATSEDSGGGPIGNMVAYSHVATLEHVKVSRCPGVLQNDDEALAALLGHRFTTM
jgi:hypothetical protein